MKNLFYIFSVLVCILSDTCLAQSDSIKSFKIIGGYEFQQYNKRLTRREMLVIMKPNPNAYKLMKESNSNFGMATISAVIGGGLIGYPIGVYVVGGKPNWLQLWTGVGLVTFSGVLGKISDKKAFKAAGIYNSGISSNHVPSRLQMGILFSGNQLGVKLTF